MTIQKYELAYKRDNPRRQKLQQNTAKIFARRRYHMRPFTQQSNVQENGMVY